MSIFVGCCTISFRHPSPSPVKSCIWLFQLDVLRDKVCIRCHGETRPIEWCNKIVLGSANSRLEFNNWSPHTGRMMFLRAFASILLLVLVVSAPNLELEGDARDHCQWHDHASDASDKATILRLQVQVLPFCPATSRSYPLLPTWTSFSFSSTVWEVHDRIRKIVTVEVCVTGSATGMHLIIQWLLHLPSFSGSDLS